MLSYFLFNVDFTKTKFICLDGDFVLLAEFCWLGRGKVSSSSKIYFQHTVWLVWCIILFRPTTLLLTLFCAYKLVSMPPYLMVSDCTYRVHSGRSKFATTIRA